MKYRITPLNLVCVLLLLLSVWLIVYPRDASDGVALIYIIPASLFGLLIDFILQIWFKNYKKLVILEIVLIALVWLMNSPVLN